MNDPASAGLTLPAPAKINRFLRVTGRRDDGYHTLATEFQFVDFADVLRFDVTPKPQIRRIDRHDFVLPDDDLIVRTARLLQAKFPPVAAHGITVTLHKKIPPGSGLGGGSSNAATTLIALNHLWDLRLSRAQLGAIGVQLGADVPSFIFGQAARASGIGEVLVPSEPVEKWLCLCIPKVAVSTAKIFANYAPTAAGIVDKTDNDLTPITAKLYPEVAETLAQLARHADAKMSGSGGAVFAEFDSHDEAKKVAAKIKNPNQTIVITQSKNRHPLKKFPAE